MKHYAIMPTDWDYNHQDKIKALREEGIMFPFDMSEVVGATGSLFPFITSKSGALKYAKDLKNRYPFVVFELMEGETWGDLKLVQAF